MYLQRRYANWAEFRFGLRGAV